MAEALCDNSGRERTSAICYAVGWTQHSVGVQYIRTAAIIQLLLGNIGRPGGGIMALRGHASIQGSTDIPTLYNLLPGYLPMPHAPDAQRFDQYLHNNESASGWWSEFPKYVVSLLKAYYGDAATKKNDCGFHWIPKLTGDHSHMTTVADMADGKVKGYFVMGENPAVGSMNGALQRKGLAEARLAGGARLLPHRDGRVLAHRARSRARRRAPRGHQDRGLLLPRRRAHREGRHLHQHPAPAAVAPQGRRAARGGRSDLHFIFTSGAG